MPRARNLKPGFFKDAKIVACSYEARLLFQGLWCLADYMGRIKYIPLEVKMEIFPADPVDIEKSMDELESNGLIQKYLDNSGATLVQVSGFTKHQNPHINEKQDRNKNPLPCLPGPEECGSSCYEEGGDKDDIKHKVTDAIRVLREYYDSDPADSLLLIPDSFNLIPDSLVMNSESGADKPRTSAHEVIDYLNSVTGSKFQKKGKTIGHVNARLDEGHSVDDMKRVVDAKWTEWKDDKKMAQYIRPETIFGASKFPGYLVAAKAAPKSKHSGFDDNEYTDHIPDWESDDE